MILFDRAKRTARNAWKFKWHNYFAWKPVKLEDTGKWVWFEFTQRRFYTVEGSWEDGPEDVPIYRELASTIDFKAVGRAVLPVLNHVTPK